MNFFEMEKSSESFDLIIFSSSFMLMPNREKALEIAKSRLSPNGRIFFLLTLY
jgi:SAM-dependent methyltransferase